MKRTVTFLAALVFSFCAFAQTPEEIVSRMETVMGGHSEADGLTMVMDMKIPILGTMSSKTYVLGEKMKMIATVRNEQVVTWYDGEVSRTYVPKTNEITVSTKKSKKVEDAGSEMEMFSGVTAGYDVSIKKETDQAWYLLCKKSKTNKEKDDPKTMELVVAKGTYMPLSISAKMSGVTMTIRDVGYEVTEADVTFNPADYPDAKIVYKEEE